jgi:hypothetical protein
MDTTNWRKFKLKDIFDIYTSSDKNYLESKEGSIPYVSSTQFNNGVNAFVNANFTNEENTITVARNGSVGSAFYHSYSYCASPDDVRIFKPKFKMNQYIGLFLCTLIEKEKFRFAYGRKFGTERMQTTTIKLPVKKGSIIDWQRIENYVKNTLVLKLPQKAKTIWEGSFDKTPVSNQKKHLNTANWKWFRYDEIFVIKKGFYNKKPEEVSGGKISFIGATDSNNGITSWHDYETIELTSKTGEGENAPIKEKIFEPNCITVSNNGSVGYAFYQTESFTCSHDINPLYLKNHTLNKYIALFLCSLIEKEQFRWAYGRKWRPIRMPKSLIKLPVTTDGDPDWKFMEKYIKSLPYSKCL